jgi:hypothetical protein
MKAVTVRELKIELSHRSPGELMELCLRLARFKKENKELLTYLLFESSNEDHYIASVKEFMDEQFDEINTSSFYYIRKSARKILTSTKKYIRYSQNKETEVELLLYFCQKLAAFKPSIKRSTGVMNMYHRQLAMIRKVVSKLHEDLQYDYELELMELAKRID